MLLFLVISVSYSLFFWLLLGGRAGFAPIAGLLGGLLLGAVATGTLVLIQSISLRRMGFKQRLADVCQSARIVLEGTNGSAAFDLCLQALDRIPGCRIGECNRSRGRITARVRANWRTWGEHIRVSIDSAADGRCEIVMSSEPAVATTLIDYGKNLDNAHRFASWFKESGRAVHAEPSEPG